MNDRNRQRRSTAARNRRKDSPYKLMAVLLLVCMVLLSARLTAGMPGQALKNAVLQHPSVFTGLHLKAQQ